MWSSSATAGGACEHPSGSGFTAAIVAGSILTTATSRAKSATTTFPATLTSVVICTSTEIAVPTPRWFVTTRPFASIRTPDARAVGVQSATTLLCQGFSSSEGSGSSGRAAVAFAEAASSTSALAAVNSRTASRPATTSSVCVHWYALPWNATGSSDSTV